MLLAIRPVPEGADLEVLVADSSPGEAGGVAVGIGCLHWLVNFAPVGVVGDVCPPQERGLGAADTSSGLAPTSWSR
eukprot:scaffold290323_cov41-Prasinocladus_malaysianus.AAC.2